MKRRFSPQLELLDRRELLSSAYLYLPNPSLSPRSVFVLSGDALTNVNDGTNTATADAVVGAGYSVGVYQQSYPKIQSVTYSMPNSLNGNGQTGYGIDKGGYAYRTSVTSTYVNTTYSSVNEYFDNKQTTDVITADVKYASSMNLPDDIYTVAVHVFAPRATIVPTFPPKTGLGSYGINWTDANNNAITSGYSPGNYFGLNAPGPAPFKFEGVYNNETPVTGTFFFTQLVTPTHIGSKGYLFNGPLETGWTPWNDNYSNGVGLDEWKGSSNSSYPISTFGYSKTVRAWDAPGALRTVFDDPGSKNPMSSRLIPYDFTYNANFTTAICFQAWGNSIPIIISSVDWSISAHYTNTAARDNATTSNAFGKPSLWAGSSQVNSGVPRNNNPRLIPGYNYNAVDFMAKEPTQYPAQGAVSASVAADGLRGVQAAVCLAGPVDDLPEHVRPRPELPWVPAKRKVYDPLKAIV